VTLDEASFYGMSFEAKTLDYINRIDDVERFAKDLRIDRKIIQKYNRQRDKEDINKKYIEFEHYSSKFESNYLTESGYASRKEVFFTNSEYYDQTIGTLSTTIEIRAVYGDMKEFSILDIHSIIEKLEERYFNMYKDCFNDEYLETLN
jgi:hypothetical protein